jgi:hypothetical protein
MIVAVQLSSFTGINNALTFTVILFLELIFMIFGRGISMRITLTQNKNLISMSTLKCHISFPFFDFKKNIFWKSI